MEYLSLLLIGLSYGATACMFSCMPFLSPLLLTERGKGGVLRAVSLFSAGRIVSYTTTALAAFLSAFALRSVLDDPLLAQSLLGGSTIWVGLLLFLRTFHLAKYCTALHGATANIGDIGIFGMGFAIAMTPCTPVLSLAAVAASARSAPEALLMGMTFGVGAVALSWVVFGFVFLSIAREAVAKLSQYQVAIQRIAAVLLVAVGINVFRSALQF